MNEHRSSQILRGAPAEGPTIMIIMLPCWLNIRSFKVHAAMFKAGKKDKQNKCGSKKERRRKLNIKVQKLLMVESSSSSNSSSSSSSEDPRNKSRLRRNLRRPIKQGQQLLEEVAASSSLSRNKASAKWPGM